jgi:hypothetical protein
MARSKRYTVDVRLGGEPPAGTAALYAFDTYGKPVAAGPVEGGKAAISLSDDLRGTTVRFVAGPPLPEGIDPSLVSLRRLGAWERLWVFDPGRPVVLDIPEIVWDGWRLCRCTVRGRVVKAVTQPSGASVDYPVCGAEVHICEVDRIPKIIWRLPDDIVLRLHRELLRRLRPVPLPEPDPIGPIGDRLRSARPVALVGDGTELGTVARLELATTALEVRPALIDVARLYPFWCWFEWLDPFFTYHLDCSWVVTTDQAGEFEATIWHPCSDQPDLYLWVRQLLDTGWKTIYARGPRCDTHWDYACGSEITIRVTDPAARVCLPPPEVEVPDGVDTWVLPMAVGSLEIAGIAGSPTGLGWVLPDGHVSYSGGPANLEPITDAPLGGYLRFRMLHSLDLPRPGLERYRWWWRRKPVGSETVAWTGMTEPVWRHYQLPGIPPTFPVYTLGPGPDSLYEFRPHAAPAPGNWPVSGFTEDLWSAKLGTSLLDPGMYQIRVTVHDAAGAVVAPGPSTFRFVVTDTRALGETYTTRLADASEIVDGGFVFEALVDNGVCTAVLHPPSLSGGTVADDCGFLRYPDPDTTDVTLAFEASHDRDRAWFTLGLARGTGDVPQVSVTKGGATGATTVPVDTNPPPPWALASYTGDGDGNFSGTFPASRLLEACENAAFAMELHVRAKAHNGSDRLSAYDAHALSAFALAEEHPGGGPGPGGPGGGGPGGGPPSP